MAREHEDIGNEPRDYSRYIWWGILAAVAVMIVMIMLLGQRQPNRSEVRAKHILVKFNASDPAEKARALERVQRLRERLVNGENFEKVARESSEDEGSAGRGGDLGPIHKGRFQERFENYVWTAPLNQLSDIVQTSYGFHLIVVTDRYTSPGDAYEMELEQRVVEQGERRPAVESEAAPPAEPAS